jgi:preprotein translocase subunit SecA
VLNAKNHEQEGEIIKHAGEKGAVTIATNMAGRGVDIKVNDEVKELGGLYIIGTERHENRRIDNQLRGRSGRQGDPGTSQFYLSLEDNLLRIFGSDKIKNIMERLGVEDGEYIESKMVSRAVEKAQKKVETMHFEGRKHIVEYDDVANEQRKIVYKFRNEILDPEYDISAKVEQNREEYLQALFEKCEIFEGMAHEEYNIEKLVKLLQEEIALELTEEELKNKEYEELFNYVLEKAKQDYEEKMSVVDEETRKDIERELYLKVVDEGWREHLYQMDNMKTGIRLRAYNQKDPLVEYKKESFNLFTELINDLKANIIKTLHMIRFQIEDPEEEARKLAQKLEIERKQEEMQRSLNLEEEEDAALTQKKKIARNDPCPCGSGKKYKQCCGKSGPKKGVFAS